LHGFLYNNYKDYSNCNSGNASERKPETNCTCVVFALLPKHSILGAKTRKKRKLSFVGLASWCMGVCVWGAV
jgi:hypothetical protein